jgi:hypothetical protein
MPARETLQKVDQTSTLTYYIVYQYGTTKLNEVCKLAIFLCHIITVFRSDILCSTSRELHTQFLNYVSVYLVCLFLTHKHFENNQINYFHTLFTTMRQPILGELGEDLSSSCSQPKPYTFCISSL